MSPSEPQDAQETPQQACERLLGQAIGYIGKKTASWTLQETLWAFADTEVGRLSHEIDTAILASNPEATAAACKAWWKAILAHAPQEEGAI